MTLSSFVFAGACASIVSDNDSTTNIATDPQNAHCELQGSNFNRSINTPAQISLPADAAPITVVCEAEGFRQTSKDMDTSADGWIVGNILFGGGIGIIIDAVRGAGQKYPENLTVILEPGSFDSLGARDAWYDARRQEINDEWDNAIRTIEQQCNRNMKELCTQKKNDAEDIRALELEALEQRRQTAVVSVPDSNSGPQAQKGSPSTTTIVTRKEDYSGDSGTEQIAKALRQTHEQSHPYDGTWTGKVVMMHCNTYGAPRRFDLTLDVENGRIHGGDPDGRYSADGEVTADGQLQRTSLNNYFVMEGSISSGTLRIHSRDCGAHYELQKADIL